MEVFLPDTVYHGTLLTLLDSFKAKPLNKENWVVRDAVDPNIIYRRDFGFGLYTTPDFDRASKFSRNKIQRDFELKGEVPCVLEFEVLKHQPLSILVNHSDTFLSICHEWSKRIYRERIENNGDTNFTGDPILISGPIADNSYSNLLQGLQRFHDSKRAQGLSEEQVKNDSIQWFQDQIIRSSTGHKISYKDLNFQIVFRSDEYQILRLRKYHTFSKEKGWSEHNEY
ncbi:DUF3990 domain-containing protein [Paenibacillus sp. LjRoot153]